MEDQKWKIKKVYPIAGRKDFFKYTIQSSGILAKDLNSKDMFFDDLKQAKVVCKAKNKVSRIEAIAHFNSARGFYKGNTQIEVLPNVTVLKLFGNEIAYKYNDPQNTLSITTAGYKINTTKELLNGLSNVNISQSKGIWYLNGLEWDGKLIDIKTNKK